MTIISDLSPELVDEILYRTPLTSIAAVRSTSKQWNASSKARVVCNARVRDQFLGFMKLDFKVCSVRFQGELEDLSIKQVAKLNQFQISRVFHCDGLLLCVCLDSKKLVIWNPYLNQTRIIESRNPFRLNHYTIGYDSCDHYGLRKKNSIVDHYGIGYDTCGRYKILRFLDCFTKKKSIVKRELEYEIYDFDSNSWRGLDVNPDWEIKNVCHGVSLKGRSYWIAGDRIMKEGWNTGEELRGRFLLCFDYTSERFRSRLELPVKEYLHVTGTLSCVRQEQLAVLFLQPDSYMMMEIWVTTKIELDHVSWSKFLVYDMTPCRGIQSAVRNGNFFVDEDKKVAMLFDLCLRTDTTPRCNKVYIIGEDGYYKEADLGPSHCRPSVCSYVPSLVQI